MVSEAGLEKKGFTLFMWTTHLTQNTGVSLKSFSERVKQTTLRVRLSSTMVRQLTGALTRSYIAGLNVETKMRIAIPRANG